MGVQRFRNRVLMTFSQIVSQRPNGTRSLTIVTAQYRPTGGSYEIGFDGVIDHNTLASTVFVVHILGYETHTIFA
ncbi:hypothetical protein EVAR_84933_1 [Eumeta japonica]|uniref:Uncharacterized protein n=1 Tax=Eumeta variegata TaxID=151549 RepID=A0A4C1VGB7_EUMVA|nr:hypothetical protein EVAR_84933_1 [Eumeta japonica]